MTIGAGTRLGPYEILSPLGAGGMGEVFKARDTRLDRLVAIKILPAHTADDPAFRARFEREAKVISSLDHPHICALYDVGDHDGAAFLVMQFLEGETLEERLKRGPVPLAQALKFAAEISDALDKAHRQGIVHRDLKPGNIMLTAAGSKLLDFGLAKVSTPLITGAGLTAGPTTPATLTAQGAILGTFQYMAPEQLEGKDADARTDIFAFGAVVYEMIAGRKAFDGKTHASLISSIMSAEPPSLTAIQALTPAALDQIVRTCLAKDPNDRWQSAHDMMRQIEWIARSGSSAGSGGTGALAPAVDPARRRERTAWTVAGVFAAVATIAVAVWLRGGAPPPGGDADVVRLSLLPPEKTTIERHFSLSPDGRRLAFAGSGVDGTNRLWIQSIDQPAAQLVPGTDHAERPFWSPDGRFVGFFASGKLKKVEIAGGAPQTICDAPTGFGPAWGANGTIVFYRNFAEPFMAVPASGGTPAPALKGDAAKLVPALHPSFLPDGTHVLFFVRSSQPDVQGIYVSEVGSSQATRVIAADSAGEYGSGHIVFIREGALMAQPFDPSALKVTGDPTTIASHVEIKEDENLGWFSVSKNGRLAYKPEYGSHSQLVWLDASGKELSRVTADAIGPIGLSPDERRVTIDRNEAQTHAEGVFLLDLARGVASAFSSHASANQGGFWSPDGTRIAFASDRGARRYYNIFEKPVAGGDATTIVTSDEDKLVHDWSRDGRLLLFQSRSKETKLDLWTVTMTGDHTATPWLKTRFNESGGQFSPDGRWVAYVSDESGQDEVFVQPFSAASPRVQVSVGGANTPRWSGDGRQLYYVSQDRKLMAVAVTTQPTLETGRPAPLFDLPPITDIAVSRTAGRFLVNQPIIDPAASTLNVVLNWPASLRK